MRQMLEKKSLEEIRFLEQKVLDIKNHKDKDFEAVFKESYTVPNGRVVLMERNPGAAFSWDEKVAKTQFVEDQNTDGLQEGYQSQPLSSPSETDYVKHMSNVLGDPRAIIKEDAAEHSAKDTSIELSNKNILSERSIPKKNTNPYLQKASLPSEKEMYSDQTTVIQNINDKSKISHGESAVIHNSDLINDQTSSFHYPGKWPL